MTDTFTSPFSQETAFSARHIVDGALSPSTDEAVVALSETVGGARPDDDVQRVTLWRVDLSTGCTRRLTSLRVASSSPRFGPDGDQLYFLSARDLEAKDQQVHQMPMGGGDPEAVTTLPGGTTAFAVSPDGRRLACVSPGRVPPPNAPGDHVRVTRTAYRYDPISGYLQDAAQGLFIVELDSGAVTAAAEPDGIVIGFAWAPDSRRVAYVRQMGTACDLFAHGDLCVTSPGNEALTLVRCALVGPPFWSTDGTRVGYCAPPDGDFARQGRVWTVPATGGLPEVRTASIDRPFPGAFQVDSPAARAVNVALAANDAVVLTMAKGGEGHLVRVALSGPEHMESIAVGPRIHRLLDLRDGRILYSAQDFNTPTELRLVGVDGRNDARVADFNAEWRDRVRWPRIERIEARSPDGTPIEAWALLPSDQSAPHRAILYNHGGPHAAWGHGFGEDIHVLVGAGYAVVLVNPRGSVGYGDAFATAIGGRWGEIERDDFHAVLDWLVEDGIVDPKRIGVMGVSGGGHLAASLIVHSDRFAAAVPEQGVYSMLSMYGVADCGAVLVGREMGGKPHQRPELYWRLSPVAHAHRCQTPTLLIQGEDDVRCPMQQAEEFYTALRDAGCTVELLRLARCSHGTQMVGPPSLRRFRMDAIIDWFGRYLQ